MTETRATHEVHHVTFGEGRRDALLLHGSLANHKVWLPVMERLRGDLRMTAVDLPGHGASGGWDGAGDYMADCVDVAERYCGADRDLLGHSFGGAVTLALAATRIPERVRSMVLIEPVLFAAARGDVSHADYLDHHRPVMDAMAAEDHARAARLFYEIWGGDTAWSSLPAAHRDAMARQIRLVPATAAGLEEDALGILEDDRLERLKAPVLLIRGTRTHPVIGAIHAKLLDRLPNAREEVIDDAGHMLVHARAERVADLVRAHLSG